MWKVHNKWLCFFGRCCYISWSRILKTFMEFQHLLITRFNIRNLSFDKGKDNTSWVMWTEKRIPIFLEFTIPSVQNQTNQNFTWLVLIDDSTPRRLIEKITSSVQLSNIKWCFLNSDIDFCQELRRCVREVTLKKTPWIITSNLDNDDVLHKDAIKSIQDNFIPIQDHLIYLSNGYVYDPLHSLLSHYYYPRSPFYSIIEKSDGELKGLFFKTHSHWAGSKMHFLRELKFRLCHQRNRRVTFIIDKPLWAQTIHENNVTNDFFRGFPVLKGKKMQEFGVHDYTQSMNLKTLFKYCNYVYWKRYLFCSILKMVSA